MRERREGNRREKRERERKERERERHEQWHGCDSGSLFGAGDKTAPPWPHRLIGTRYILAAPCRS